MRIYKDILNALKIETAYILANEILYMCIPLEIRKHTWYVSCDSNDLKNEVVLKVKFNGSFIYLKSKILQKEQDSLYTFTYELEIEPEEKNKDSLKRVFFAMIAEMEENAEKWNKRKENRYDIGLDEARLKAINFKTAEQIIVADKLQLPCVVNNISYGGAKITTIESNFHKDKKVCLYLSFINPIEQIPIVASVRNCFLKTTMENKPVSVLSVKYEHSPYEYKKRLDAFIKRTEE